MGLSSSQARMLLLTARKSDLEYRAQMISQRKINLAMQTQDLAQKYSEALNNRVMQLQYATVNQQAQYEKLSYTGLTQNNTDFIGDFIVKTANGKYAVTDVADALKVAAKVIGAVESKPVATTILKFKELEEGVTTTDLTYSALTKNNTKKKADSATADYIVKDADGKIVAPDKKSALIMVAKMQNLELDQNQVNNEDYQDKLLSGVEYVTDENVSNSTKFQNGILAGDYVLYQANFDDNNTKTYAPVQDIENNNHIVVSTVQKFDYQPIDLNSMSTEEKQGLLNLFQEKYGQFALISEMNNADYFQDALRNGGLFLQKLETTQQTDINGDLQDVDLGFKTVPWSSVSVIADVSNKEDDAQAEADYESKSLTLSNQDKMLDLELNQIQTQHKAIETEYDSVKKVIEKNIDISYKIFA